MGRKKKQMTATKNINLNINKKSENMNTGKRRGRPRKNQVANFNVAPVDINFDIIKLNNLDIDPRMMETMKSGMLIDDLISQIGRAHV